MRIERNIYRWENNIKVELNESFIKLILDSSVSGYGQVSDFREHNNRSSGATKRKGFFDKFACMHFSYIHVPQWYSAL